MGPEGAGPVRGAPEGNPGLGGEGVGLRPLCGVLARGEIVAGKAARERPSDASLSR